MVLSGEAEEVGQEQAASEHETASGERAATDTAGFAAEVESMIEEASNEDEGEAAQEAEEGPEEEENPRAEGEEGLEEGDIPPAAGAEGNAVVFAQRKKQEKGYFKWHSVDLGGHRLSFGPQGTVAWGTSDHFGVDQTLAHLERHSLSSYYRTKTMACSLFLHRKGGRAAGFSAHRCTDNK